jgi:hypothetical protein
VVVTAVETNDTSGRGDPRTFGPTHRWWWWNVGGAAIVGVIIRFVYVLTVRRDVPLIGDAETYYRLGQGLTAGNGYVRPLELGVFGESVPTAEFPPLWPTLLAVFDVLGVESQTGQRLMGSVIAASAIVLIGLLGRAIGGPAVGAVAAWIAAVYPHFVVYGGSLLSEGVMLPILALVLLGVVRARSSPDEASALRWWVVVSVAMAAAVMTRSEMMLLFVLLVVPAAWSSGDPRRRLRRLAVVGACTVAVVGVWTVRNLIALDGFVPLTNNSGTALAGSNCDAVYGGPQIGGWRLDCVPEGDYLGLGEVEVARINRDAGLAYIGDHVGELPAVVAARLGRTFGVWDIERTVFLGSLEDIDHDWLWAAWYGWLVMVPVAVAGAVVLRRRGGELWPLMAPVVMVVVVTVTTYGNLRFRVAAEPSAAVLSAYAVVAAWRRWNERRASSSAHEHAPGGSL